MPCEELSNCSLLHIVRQDLSQLAGCESRKASLSRCTVLDRSVLAMTYRKESKPLVEAVVTDVFESSVASRARSLAHACGHLTTPLIQCVVAEAFAGANESLVRDLS